MIKYESYIQKDDPVYSFKMKGISLSRFKSYVYSEFGDIEDFFDKDKNNYFIPGSYILGLFRYFVKEIYKQNNNFPLKKLSIFSDGPISLGTENPLYVGDNFEVKFKYMAESRGSYIFVIELKNEIGEILLSGFYKLTE